MRVARAARPKAEGFGTAPLRGHKRRPIAISLALLFVLGFLPLPMIVRADWFSGFGYRKSHTITGTTAGAQTNYQMKMIVHYGSGTDSGGDVYCNSLCRTDFGDVRFTGSDGESQLDYWIETKTDGNSATIWVEVPSIPANPSTATIYIYYGRSGVSTTSNGASTFAFFDDAQTDKSGSYSYVNIFNPAMSATFSYDSSSKWYQVTHTIADAEFIQINGLNLAQLEIWCRFRVLVQGGTSNDQFGFLIRNQASGRYYSRCLRFFNPDRITNYRNDGANPSVTETQLSTADYSGNVIAINTWYQCKLHAYGNDLWFWSDLEDRSTSTSDSTYPGAGGCGVVMGFDVETRVAFKDIVVRNYCSPEPTNGGWGAQEPEPVAFAFVDGGSVSINGQTTLATLYTSFPSGNNFVMAIVQVQCGTSSTIGSGSLWLQRVGGSILMSNYYAIDVGGTADARKWQALMGIDSSAGASPSYIVTTTASNAAMIGEAKILAISGVTGAQSTYAEVDIDNSETTLATLATSLQAGDNIVIAIFETINTGTGTKALSYVRLKRSATLAESQLPVWHGASGNAGARQCQLIPYLDASAPASPTYTATAQEAASGSKIKGAAKIVAFRKNLQAGDLQTAYVDGSQQTLPGGTETYIASLSTDFQTGSEVVVIASEQFASADFYTREIAAGANKLQYMDLADGQRVNEYTIYTREGGSSPLGDCGAGFGLLNRHTNILAYNPDIFKTKATASANYIYAESKILALGHKPPGPVPEFPLGALLPLATGLATSYAARKIRKRISHT